MPAISRTAAMAAAVLVAVVGASMGAQELSPTGFFVDPENGAIAVFNLGRPDDFPGAAIRRNRGAAGIAPDAGGRLAAAARTDSAVVTLPDRIIERLVS